MSAQPLYEQVKTYVTDRIRSGAWRPGARVLSEHEFVRELGVSRMTANRALRELVTAGVLSRVAGLGTFVADLPAAGQPLEIRNVAADIRDRGHVHRATPLLKESAAPPAEVAAQSEIAMLLDIPAGSPVLLIERTTWSRGRPAAFARLHHAGSRFELRGVYDV